jgi:hypothetical protein
MNEDIEKKPKELLDGMVYREYMKEEPVLT